MAQIGVDLGLYKLPSNEILRHRKAYYDLCKRHDDETETWLNRIQSQINRCEFPSVMSREYLLIDKFVCELDKDQRNFIQSVDTWTLEQLKEYFIYANADTVEAVRRMKPNCSTNNISDENLEIAPSSMIHVKGELVSTFKVEKVFVWLYFIICFNSRMWISIHKILQKMQ